MSKSGLNKGTSAGSGKATPAKKRRGLGRGLDALLGGDPSKNSKPAAADLQDAESRGPESASNASTAGSLPTGSLEIDVKMLEPNRYQPRSHFDESSLEELAESIRSQGLVQPIVVTPKEDGIYAIIAGERRWRAAQKAGLDKVPVVVRKVDDDRELLELALVENIQRADLDPIEEAEAYRLLGEKFAISQDQISKRVGKARSTVTNTLRLLRLPGPVQDLLRDGRLTAGQARPLLALPDPSRQIALAERAVVEGLTARDLERLAADSGEEEEKKAKPKDPLDANTKDAMERLMHSLQTQVEIVRRRRGGQVRIHFSSEDELIRLYDRITQGD